MSPSRLSRILFLDQSGELGGAEFCLLDSATAFREHCQVITFANGAFPAALREREIPHSTIPLSVTYTKSGGGPFQSIRILPDVASLVRRIAREAKNFDGIVANTPKAALVGAVASSIARRPFVYHLHDILTTDHFSRLNRHLLVRAANTARRVICNSEATREAFMAAGGKADRTEVVYNGFDASPYKSVSPESVRGMRSQLGIPMDTFTIIIAGRLTAWKGQHVLLEALKELPSAQALVIGEALFTDQDRAYAAHLKWLAQKPDLAGRVHFLGFRRDLPALFTAADAVVHASTAAEPFGRVIVEGMLAGKPVIATDAGGAREVLRNGVTGYLVQPGDAAALAGALRTLEENPDSGKHIGETAREDALARFSLEEVTRQYRDILSSVCA